MQNPGYPRAAYILLSFFVLLVLVLSGCNAKNTVPASNPAVSDNSANSTAPMPLKFTLSSPAFNDSQKIPYTYTCDGADVMPPLSISNIPRGTQSLALIIDDPDATFGTFLHFFAWNLPVSSSIPKSVPVSDEAVNGFKSKGYSGPCPPSGTHHYYFTVYAMNTNFTSQPATSRKEFERTHSRHIIEKAQLVGIYSRK